MGDQVWNSVYPGDSSQEAYQEQFQQLAPVGWEVIETTQGDLLTLLMNRVEATTGAPVILGLGSLARERPEALSNEIITTIMECIAPRRAKTLFASLVAGWRTSTGYSVDEAPQIIAAELKRAIRRLQALDLPQPELLALEQIHNLLYPDNATRTNIQDNQQEAPAGTT